MPIKCFAIDDEPLALKLMRSYIEQTPFLRLAGCFSNADAIGYLFKPVSYIDAPAVQPAGSLRCRQAIQPLHQGAYAAAEITTTPPARAALLLNC
ncbi:MAG: hypothetical protein LBK22_04185 [Tannerella sp.]|jgi:hypothetical protein|nr:hypothetical protein [Tannerella sp.]